jgi:hypothetical protein
VRDDSLALCFECIPRQNDTHSNIPTDKDGVQLYDKSLPPTAPIAGHSRAVLAGRHGPDRVSGLPPLDEQELADLVAYLESL